MTETNATSEYCCTCQSWQNKITACGDPAEIARKVKFVFKKMPGEMALACFAKVMTAELPHPIKVAVWDAVRYSHVWWGVGGAFRRSNAVGTDIANGWLPFLMKGENDERRESDA